MWIGRAIKPLFELPATMPNTCCLPARPLSPAHALLGAMWVVPRIHWSVVRPRHHRKPSACAQGIAHGAQSCLKSRPGLPGGRWTLFPVGRPPTLRRVMYVAISPDKIGERLRMNPHPAAGYVHIAIARRAAVLLCSPTCALPRIGNRFSCHRSSASAGLHTALCRTSPSV